MKERFRNLFHSPGFMGSDRSDNFRSENSISPRGTNETLLEPTNQLLGTAKPVKQRSNDVSVDEKPLQISSMLTPVMQEQLDLRLASADNPSVVMELDLDCNLTYVSNSWEQLVGTRACKLLNKPISNILIGSTDADLTIFEDAVAQMIHDNASYKVKFVTATNDVEFEDKHISSSSIERNADGCSPDIAVVDTNTHICDSSSTSSKVSNNGDVIELEAQGIVIFSPITKLPTHSIWTVRPFLEIDLDLTIPDALVDLLGFGAEIFEGYLVILREAGIIDENSVPEPKSFLCRICETSFPAWFIEKHSDLCLLEHKVAEEVQFCNEAVDEHRLHLLAISESLWKSQFQSGSGGSTPNWSSSSLSLPPINNIHYKGMSLGHVFGSDQGTPSRPPACYPKNQIMNSSLRQSRKFPFGILQRLVDYCDEALLINAAKKSDVTGYFEFSPNTQNSMKLVTNWQMLETSDHAISAMVDDTKALVTEKVDQMSRLLRVLQYSEKIKEEVDEQVLKSVSETVSLIREKTRQRESSVSSSKRYSLCERQISDRNSTSSCHRQQNCWDQQEIPVSSQSSYHSIVPSVSAHSTPSIANQSIHSPQPSRVRSPTSRILGDSFNNPVELSRPLPSLTPQDLLTGTPTSFDSGVSLSPNTSFSKSAGKDLPGSMDALNLGLKSPDNVSLRSLRSSTSSPRLLFSPAPYVEKPALSALQRNTNAIYNHDLSPRPSYSDNSSSPMKAIYKRSTSSSSISIPSSSNTEASVHASTVASLSHIASHSQSSGNRSSFSSPRPPLSPLLVSQPTNQKAPTGGIKDYEILKAISKGAFGSVFLAKRRLTGDYVAIKCLKKKDMIAKNQVLNVRSERAVMMKQTDSPYVAQLHCSFQTKDYLYLVMEYLNGGDCATVLKLLGALGDKWSKRYIAEVIVGVNDLHKRGIIHRDLKPDNLLIDSQGHLKLTDFGLSRIGVVGRHTYRNRKSSASEHGIELFRKSLSNNPNYQSPLANSTAVESPELAPSSHKRNSSVTPFWLSPSTDQHKFNFASHGHSASISSHESTGQVISGTKKRSISHFRASSNRSGSASSGMDSPNLKPANMRSPSESSFALLDDDCEFSVSPSQNNDSIHSFALFDPKQQPDIIKKFVGTPDYLAPETITGDRQGEYSDWWSIGCILFEFLYGYAPFHAATPEEVFQNILKGEIDWPPLPEDEDLQFCTPEAKDLIKKLLTLDFESRLGYNGAEEIMQHPYFAGINWDTLYQETPDSFIPTLDGPDSTDYFDLRGADISHFPTEDLEHTIAEPLTQSSNSDNGFPGTYLSTPTTPVSAKKERRGSKLVDPSEFGSFNFRNLNVLEKANKDVINRLKSEHLEHRSSISSSSSDSFTPGHSKSRGSSISSNVVNLGSPFKRPVSPAPHFISSYSVPPPPGLEKQSFRVNKKWEGGSPAGSTGNGGRSRSSVPSLSRQILSRTTNDFTLSPSSSDNEDALYRVQNRRESVRRLNSSASGSSQGTQGTQSPQRADATFFKHNELDVLYCEPIPIVRHTVSKILEKQGCIVLSIADGEDLIRRATSKVKFDLIFTALRLTRIEAVDAVKLIKYTSGVNSNTPIIAITGFSKEAIDSEIFDDVLEKPVDESMVHNLMTKFHFSNVAIESEQED